MARLIYGMIMSLDGYIEYFLRVMLPVTVRGTVETCSWGVWVEADESSYTRTYELWDAPQATQRRAPPFAASLANTLKGYTGTLGLPGRVQLTGPTTTPQFTLDSDLLHPLALEQGQGVFPERVVEWLAAHIH